MATPINNNPQARTTPVNEPSPSATVPTPGGVGNAPTTLNSAAQPVQSPQPEGYIVPFLNWLSGWISWIFKKVFCCCAQGESAPVTPNQPVQDRAAAGATPSNAPLAQINAVPIESIQREARVRRAFENMPELERALIYQDIGRSRARPWSVRSYEEIGRRAAVDDYRLLERAMSLPD